MGFKKRLRRLFSTQASDIEPERKLLLASGFNVRELGGYAVTGGETRWRRFVRSGSLDMLSEADQVRLHDYGVRLVVDLRGDHEVGLARDRLAFMRDVRYAHVPLYDFDLSDPELEHEDDSYLSLGYFTMLANRPAIRKIFSFFATAARDEAILFHCAAGMDRTGVTAMLLLGLARASVERVVADYCYSFASVPEVDRLIFEQTGRPRRELALRRDSMFGVYGKLLEVYGSVEEYLAVCGVSADEVAAVRSHLLDA